MTIGALVSELKGLAETLPKGFQSEVTAWVRVPNAGEAAVLKVSSVAQGYRPQQGGEIATINLDEKA